MAKTLSDYRNPVYHFRGPSTFPGPYIITDAALKNYGVSRELFGSTTIIVSDAVQFNVKDYQYPIATDADGNVTEVGMHILPVSNNSFVPDASGNPVPGSQMVDNLIRQEMGIGVSDMIYALISYMHPELNNGTIAALSQTDKAQLGFTHLGAYIGNGITTNSPVAYHFQRFGCDPLPGTDYGYPCNIHIVGLKGVDQAVFNRNCNLVDLLVSHGLEFPGDYTNSMFRPEYINAALMYYRDWLMQEDYLRNDPTWYFYCAANKLTVLNIACNLPHNPNAFQEVYGDEAGLQLWQQFLNRYTNVTGFDFYYYPGLQTDFVPLWKQQGLTAADIQPFTIDQYNGYDAYRRLGTAYNGPTPTLPPLAVVCAPQSTADFISEFEQIYADFYDAGALSSIGVIRGFMTPVLQRTGLPESEYISYSLTLFQKMCYSEARASAAATVTPDWTTNTWFWTSYFTLVTIFGGTVTSATPTAQDIATIQGLLAQKLTNDQIAEQSAPLQTINPQLLATYALLHTINNWDKIMQDGMIPRDEAYIEYMESQLRLFKSAEGVVVTDPSKIQYNVLPATFNLITNGMYTKNDFITIKTICTAVDVSEIELVAKS